MNSFFQSLPHLQTAIIETDNARTHFDAAIIEDSDDDLTVSTRSTRPTLSRWECSSCLQNQYHRYDDQNSQMEVFGVHQSAEKLTPSTPKSASLAPLPKPSCPALSEEMGGWRSLKPLVCPQRQVSLEIEHAEDQTYTPETKVVNATLI